MAEGMDTSSPFQCPLTPLSLDNPERLQSTEHMYKSIRQMDNENTLTEKPLSLHLTYLNDPDIQAHPVVHKRMENILRQTSSKVDFLNDQIRLLGSCPVLNFDIHYAYFNVLYVIYLKVNLKSKNLNNLKRANDCLNDGWSFQIIKFI
ncbi:hypothetical protein CDAR_258991 [Caerostris darwini]|uniref:Uncharacterized protein n=1 Tax=Caerostris darwini TaxID=1538125 RepID=A0AAV4PQ33_9ARAC|nr:hypothetical protein CDAR_258991 [Caerostris darwini]